MKKRKKLNLTNVSSKEIKSENIINRIKSKIPIKIKLTYELILHFQFFVLISDGIKTIPNLAKLQFTFISSVWVK